MPANDTSFRGSEESFGKGGFWARSWINGGLVVNRAEGHSRSGRVERSTTEPKGPSMSTPWDCTANSYLVNGFSPPMRMSSPELPRQHMGLVISGTPSEQGGSPNLHPDPQPQPQPRPYPGVGHYP